MWIIAHPIINIIISKLFKNQILVTVIYFASLVFAGQAQLLNDRDRRDLCREISQKDRGSRNTTIAFKKIILLV